MFFQTFAVPIIHKCVVGKLRANLFCFVLFFYKKVKINASITKKEKKKKRKRKTPHCIGIRKSDGKYSPHDEIKINDKEEN